MIYTVDGAPVAPADGLGLLGVLSAHRGLELAARAFTQRAPQAVTGKCVVALQGEVALAGAAEALVLGSGDATTCLVALLHDAASATASVAHFDDGVTQEAVAAALASMVAPSLWLVGGYADAAGAGARVSEAVLRFFHRAATPITLRLFAAGRHNTSAAGAPLCQAAALELRGAAPAPFPALFPDRGPALAARSAQLFLGGAPGPPASVYLASSRLRFRLRAGAAPSGARAVFEDLEGVPDGQLLQALSTSPDHELPHIAGDLRASIAWVLAQSGAPHVLSLEYGWGEGRGWQAAAAGDSGTIDSPAKA